jgi:uncharacterized membrane protein YdjX (TVP38/TMEM64 family)
LRFSNTLKSVGVCAAVLAAFVGVSVFAHAHQGALKEAVHVGGVWGIAAFIVLTAIFVVFLLPLDVSVLIPLAAVVWGPVGTAIMSVAGWTLGSSVAFFLARRFGAPVVARLAGKARLREAERTAKRTIPKRHLFWWALITQALLPIDLISYVFGLFTDIELGPYALATALGDLVPGFFFAYAGTLPAWYQIGALIIGLAIAGLLFWRAEAVGK